jgi:hypothetical protein
MSSVQSAFAQVGPREKYLVATGAAVGVTVDAGEVVTSSMSSTAFGDVTSSANATSGQLFLDLGKTVTVYDGTTLLAVEKYQKVALVNGPDTEGNDADAAVTNGDRYLRVWNSAGANPLLARTG